ncbi:hypothetical protein ACEN2J_08985 [Pseudorhodobacter sp. W20_MBD10_FR17]|uniref:porin n=1 Tax=Pseudorhodobacter sp. W20_MBD10_FR17 TaxID=3240266 RepID=UPI003F95EEA1
MKSILISTAAVAMALPAMVAAQALNGTATVGYGYNDVMGGSNIHTPSIDGRFDYDNGNALHFGGDISGLRGSANGLTGKVSALVGGVNGKYQFSNGFNLGAYGERASVDVTGLAGNRSVNSIGLMGGYDVETTKVSAFFGNSKTSKALAAGSKMKDYGIMGRFTASDQLTLGGSLARSTVSGSGSSADLDFVGIAGAYRMGQSVTVFGGLTDSNLSTLGSVTTFGLGASFDMSSHMSEGTNVSVELARSNVTGAGHMNSLRVGLSVPIGSSSNAIPLNSVADTAMNPRHNALSSAILSAF